MANIIRKIRPPVGVTAAQLLTLFGAGALIRVQRATSQNGTFADISTPTYPLVSGTEEYTAYDPTGLSSSWYRIRFESADGTKLNDWKTQPAEYA